MSREANRRKRVARTCVAAAYMAKRWKSSVTPSELEALGDDCAARATCFLTVRSFIESVEPLATVLKPRVVVDVTGRPGNPAWHFRSPSCVKGPLGLDVAKKLPPHAVAILEKNGQSRVVASALDWNMACDDAGRLRVVRDVGACTVDETTITFIDAPVTEL